MIHLLESTIGWIRKNPVGLKLNHQVSECLAQFFSYHIFLWDTFISVVYSKYVVTAFLCSGVLGISVLIASLIDVVNLLTIHILCFHIYASRLATISFKALLSLLRLFRGAKYNPLRKRVDSVILDSRQLFLATLFLTTLIFLFPTIGVYYSVFSVLHYTVCLIRFVLLSSLELANSIFSY
uniref:Phosphatidylinositol glycan, class Q n=1 Tax=Steinernema glaseri TaxID=37863 RepID=A0A1I7ZB26_9BILA